MSLTTHKIVKQFMHRFHHTYSLHVIIIIIVIILIIIVSVSIIFYINNDLQKITWNAI